MEGNQIKQKEIKMNWNKPKVNDIYFYRNQKKLEKITNKQKFTNQKRSYVEMFDSNIQTECFEKIAEFHKWAFPVLDSKTLSFEKKKTTKKNDSLTCLSVLIVKISGE